MYSLPVSIGSHLKPVLLESLLRRLSSLNIQTQHQDFLLDIKPENYLSYVQNVLNIKTVGFIEMEQKNLSRLMYCHGLSQRRNK